MENEDEQTGEGIQDDRTSNEVQDDRTCEEILGQILQWLATNKYDEVRGMIFATSDRAIKEIYRDLFRSIIAEYDEDFIESGVSDPILENILMVLKSYGTTNDK